MSEVFEVSENNFYKSIRFVQKALQNFNPNQTELIAQALVEASEEFTKMNIECSRSQDIQMKQKVELFKEELKSHKKLFNEKKEKSQKDEETTNSGELLENEEALIQAKRQMYQNEAMSNEAALGIRQNNEKLRKNITRLQDINNSLTKAKKVIGSISSKMKKNKFALYGTLGILALVVCFIVYTYVA